VIVCKKVGKPTTPSFYIDEDLQKTCEIIPKLGIISNNKIKGRGK
jgi:hypothetical protein